MWFGGAFVAKHLVEIQISMMIVDGDPLPRQSIRKATTVAERGENHAMEFDGLEVTLFREPGEAEWGILSIFRSVGHLGWRSPLGVLPAGVTTMTFGSEAMKRRRFKTPADVVPFVRDLVRRAVPVNA
jgi:hypothetical protein